MTTITILPEKADSYRALAADKEATGRTAGEALDALTAQLEGDESGTLVIVQNRKADEFFTAAQQERLAELMRLHEAGSLSTEEEWELKQLVEAELVGAGVRAGAMTGAIELDLMFEMFIVQGLSVSEMAKRLNVSRQMLTHKLKRLIHLSSLRKPDQAPAADSVVVEKTD